MNSIIFIGFCLKDNVHGCWQKYSAILLRETELSESLPLRNERLNEYLSEKIGNIKNVTVIKPPDINTYCLVFSNSEGKPRYFHPNRNAKLVADSYTRIIIKITNVEEYNPVFTSNNNMVLKNIVSSDVKPVNSLVRSSLVLPTDTVRNKNYNPKIVVTSMNPFDYYNEPFLSRSNLHRSKVSPNPKVNKINPETGNVESYDGTPKPTQQWRRFCFNTCNKRMPERKLVSNSVFKNKRINGNATGSCFLWCEINRRKYVLLARKCMGPSGTHLGERDIVKHRTNEQRKKNLPWSIHGRGAAGTKYEFWGQWCTAGGTLNGNTVFEGILNELKDEFGVKLTLDNLKKLPFEILDESRNMLACEITDLTIFPYLNKTRSHACVKNLIYSSHGEIAEIRLVPLNEIYDKRTGQFKNDVNCRNGITSYVKRSFKDHYLKYLDSK